MNDAHTFKQHDFKHSRLGFTLLEMVIAAVLLAVLVTAVVSVLRVLMAETRNVGRTPASVLPESLARQLRRDVINARSYRSSNLQLDLLGYVAQDADSGEPLLTMAIASYRIRPTQRGGLLLRVQQSAGGGVDPTPTIGGSAVQPLWQGVTAIGLNSNYLDTRDVSLLPPAALQALSAEPTAKGGGWLPLSSVVEVTLLGDQRQTLFRESIARDSGTNGEGL